MERQRVVRSSRNDWRVGACQAMCVIGTVLLGHAASGEPPTEQPDHGSPTAEAPTIDRVGFPQDYQTRFKVLRVVVNEQTLKVNTVYGNEPAAAVTSREKLPYPEGSILLMEFSDALRDANNQLVRDAKGALKKGAVEHIDVMKRGKGFGEAYGADRSGEWEYAGYRLDGSYTTPPEKSAQCAACHRKAGPENDFVFRMKAMEPPK
ncbi:MAG TPA: cytochrome P460 family protein [Povalibacter sp.]